MRDSLTGIVGKIINQRPLEQEASINISGAQTDLLSGDSNTMMFVTSASGTQPPDTGTLSAKSEKWALLYQSYPRSALRKSINARSGADINLLEK